MSSIVYDFAIVGAGAAGLQVALAMKEDPFFRTKKILILEKSGKSDNDKTWCYWEKGTGPYDALLTHSWSAGYFYGPVIEQPLTLTPIRYKMLKSIDFYDFAMRSLKNSSNFDWRQEEVLSVTDGSPVRIQSSVQGYNATHVFDSRIDKDFFSKTDNSLRLLQHFRGLYIETPEAVFNPDKFVMMDFRQTWKDTTSFTYVLPTSPTTALVEFTLFSSTLLQEEDYHKMLTKYIDEILKLKEYKVHLVEAGVIPMTDYPFHKSHTANITKIGTAGGWVKPSSGYSFKNGGRFSAKLLANIKAGKRPSRGVAKGRFRFYDALLLDILVHKNNLGPIIFEDMYSKISPDVILSFLDEQTTLKQDLTIIRSVDWLPFSKALLFYPFRKLRQMFLSSSGLLALGFSST